MSGERRKKLPPAENDGTLYAEGGVFRKETAPGKDLKAVFDAAKAGEKTPDEAGAISAAEPKKIIDENAVRAATETLIKYKDYKNDYDEQVRENEEWWRLNHWRYLRQKNAEKKGSTIEPTSAWTFNSVINKHADMMDNIPAPVILPREESDEKEARTLTSIVPVINERCGFEKTYSDNSFSKIKNGLAAYSVVWKDEDNGLGDVSVGKVDILNLFWEPGICDLQSSANVFLINMVENEVLEATYPDELRGKLTGAEFTPVKYAVQEKEDDSSKSAVVDWYYKKNGVLHYVKFVGETVLFASENEEGYEDGFYRHGKYPFVLDAMYPLEGTLFSFGITAVCRDPQMYIDKLDKIVLDNLRFMAKPRWMFSKSCGVNTDDFEDPDKTVVWVEGNIDESRGRQITVSDISSIVSNWKTQKIDELKETSSNRDVSQGSTAGGVTSGAAIATLQEAGNKTSRDVIAGSYRAFAEIVKLEIELIRQFYTEERVFRIVGDDGMSDEFITYSNANISGKTGGREPVFDLKIKAQKKSPFSQTATNETAMNLYSAGFFNPDRAQEAMVALEMMDFEGIDAVKRRVSEGATLKNQLVEMQQQLAQLAQTVQMLTGGASGIPGRPSQSAEPTALPGESRGENTASRGATGGVSEARSRAEELAANGYSRALIEKARPDMAKG